MQVSVKLFFAKTTIERRLQLCRRQYTNTLTEYLVENLQIEFTLKFESLGRGSIISPTFFKAVSPVVAMSRLQWLWSEPMRHQKRGLQLCMWVVVVGGW